MSLLQSLLLLLRKVLLLQPLLLSLLSAGPELSLHTSLLRTAHKCTLLR